MGQYSEIILNATGHNFNESAYECRLFIVHPNSLNYIGTVKFDDVSIDIIKLVSRNKIKYILGQTS